MSEQASESHESRHIRIETRPADPPTFTIRATLLDGRMILAERTQKYANLAGAVHGLAAIGESVAQQVTTDALSAIVPHDDDARANEYAPPDQSPAAE